MANKDARPRIAGWLWFAQLVVAFMASLFVYFRRISVPHCGDVCDFELLQATGDAYFWACVVICVVTGVLTLALRHRTWSWCVPAVGIALVLIGAFVADQLSNRAMLF